jgi:hypothetical protein
MCFFIGENSVAIEKIVFEVAFVFEVAVVQNSEAFSFVVGDFSFVQDLVVGVGVVVVVFEGV